ncbi:hypothetical protein J2D73_18810 [Acetobacter sacchari]|uniref:Uncharacterized protein n=1 Tax=Acetobacter sacchari TaxID=2661687 RepID=A0ABS3M105_9PROT|nr:hypothetical protein [Acetobacter sacchari]MBO1361838.1 hypothetical protein [Acetobacter sacchari]
MSLDALRNNPSSFFSTSDVFVDATGVGYRPERVGGSCQVVGQNVGSRSSVLGFGFKVLKIKISDLEVNTKTNADCYYYPYRANGVGYVDVPADVRDGTLVLTDGMNGCAAEVLIRPDGRLRFCHDADGVALQGMNPRQREEYGRRVFRCSYGLEEGQPVNYAPGTVGFKKSEPVWKIGLM